jgi:hypothetical protein
MTKVRWITLGLVVALLAGVQHFGLERETETLAEAPMKRVANLPAGEVLPTYVASLFFGAFRAVAVDILWIQLRKVKEEKRWYEMREITQFISYVQPRNPEVWCHLGWDSAYNVANGFTDPEESWKWVKFGLLWLRKGIRMLPNEPYIKDQLAYTLWHKPSWRDGELDFNILKRIEGDAELQAALLPDGMKADHPMSAFELAIPWLERARDDLMSREFELTQMGLYLYPERMDGFARFSMVLQGMYDWKRDRREEAKAWFRRAQRKCEDMLARVPGSPVTPGFELKYRNHISSIFADWAKMYAKYPDLVDLEYRSRSGKPEDERAFLELLQGLLTQYGAIDEQWFWSRYNPNALLNALKLKLIKRSDTQECNDSFDMATDLHPGDLALADLAPEGLDVDYYWIEVEPPAGQDPPPVHPSRPVSLTLNFSRPETAKLDLKVTLFDPNRRPLKEQIVKREAKILTTVSEYGHYFLKVEADPPTLPWPPDTRYKFKYSVEH